MSELNGLVTIFTVFDCQICFGFARKIWQHKPILGALSFKLLAFSFKIFVVLLSVGTKSPFGYILLF